MHKTWRLMDENSVSFQMFLILLSFIILGSESQISVFKQCQSNKSLDVCVPFSLCGEGGGHAQKPYVYTQSVDSPVSTFEVSSVQCSSE